VIHPEKVAQDRFFFQKMEKDDVVRILPRRLAAVTPLIVASGLRAV
jgi:hypothetical protein